MTQKSSQNTKTKKPLGIYALVAVIAWPLLIYGAYKLFFPTLSWNERMTVTVETPNGEKVGSAVRSVKITREPAILPQMTGRSTNIKGEAVVVDLGDGKYVFALLEKYATPGWAGLAYGEHVGNPRAAFTLWARWSTYLTGEWPLELPKNRYPLLVTFDDLADPASVKEVDPDQLSEHYGEGYALKSINIDITFDWVTKGKVDEVLGWLNNKELFEKIWKDLSTQQTDLLSSGRWKRWR